MGRTILIDPVTRIEGHAKISIHLDDEGQVVDARFHVAEFRGFEKFCEGRPLWEMPSITARICGICPVSHLMASSRAGDAILAVTIPAAAEKLRRLMNLAQIAQSHALSIFHLSGPDLFLGMDADPATRHLFGLFQTEPELARGGIRLRQFGQEIIEQLGGKKIHPGLVSPGGRPRTVDGHGANLIRARMAEAKVIAHTALGRLKGLLDRFREEADTFGNFATLFMGMAGADGAWEHYGGRIRFTDTEGHTIAEGLDPATYREFLGEASQSDSYLKSPYYLPHGYPNGIYRVGPLARLNICTHMGTEQADRELDEYRQRNGRTVTSSFGYHHARLIEILTCLERIEQLLDDPDLLADHLHSRAGINQREGVGASEAPRGTLFHHYRVDEHGLITRVNLIIATGQNNLAMNRAMGQIARHYIRGPEIPEGVLNRLEAGIRAFDPCLSCSTHAVGMMPLHVQLIGPDGAVRNEAWRG